jgi:ABC-2 type transport system ATP-binding protein
MSLLVQNLVKTYGSQYAVNDISFTINKSEIVGFLGPNGAGKSSTMKVCTGYLAPTSGRVEIDGKDVVIHPLEIKKVVGYLAEHNPLYPELFVHEYLSFVGRLYGLKGKALRERIAAMIEICGLEREQNKKIEELSKGYRQRVGLAQALIHDPKVLILDEPTSGLDPNQIIEIRKVIKDISTHKTVVFSTHIMQEVKALCDRVIVLNKGEIVADDRLDNLLASMDGNVSIVAEFDGGNVSAEQLRLLNGVQQVTALDVSRFRLEAAHGHDIRSEVFRFAADNKLSLIGLRVEENTLEDIFRRLTNTTERERSKA